MNVIKTKEELQENQKGKSELVKDLSENFNISDAFKVLEYDGKKFVGFMGHMITKPTEDSKVIDDYIENLDPVKWELLLNVITVMIKERKRFDENNSNN